MEGGNGEGKFCYFHFVITARNLKVQIQTTVGKCLLYQRGTVSALTTCKRTLHCKPYHKVSFTSWVLWPLAPCSSVGLLFILLTRSPFCLPGFSVCSVSFKLRKRRLIRRAQSLDHPRSTCTGLLRDWDCTTVDGWEPEEFSLLRTKWPCFYNLKSSSCNAYALWKGECCWSDVWSLCFV